MTKKEAWPLRKGAKMGLGDQIGHRRMPKKRKKGARKKGETPKLGQECHPFNK